MCLEFAVGAGCRNGHADTKVVQVLLNASRPRWSEGPSAALAEDGRYGPATAHAIERFQIEVLGKRRSDGRIDPGGATLSELARSVPEELTAESLQGIMALSPAERVDRYASLLIQKMAQRGIDTQRRRVHFLAQIGHESGGLRYTEELASGEAYEGRRDLGNTHPGDGPRFKGRGLIQLTGRANYARYGEAIGVDLVGSDAYTTLASDPERAVDVACWFWQAGDLNALADRDDVRAVTQRINGGFNGLEDREAYLRRARFFHPARGGAGQDGN